MNAFSQRTWIPFYLVSFGTLSMLFSRSMNGVMLLASLVLVMAALGVIFLTIQAEVASDTERKELTETLSKKVLSVKDVSGSEGK